MGAMIRIGIAAVVGALVGAHCVAVPPERVITARRTVEPAVVAVGYALEATSDELSRHRAQIEALERAALELIIRSHDVRCAVLYHAESHGRALPSFFAWRASWAGWSRCDGCSAGLGCNLTQPGPDWRRAVMPGDD